jgi:hypothetical protein
MAIAALKRSKRRPAFWSGVHDGTQGPHVRGSIDNAACKFHRGRIIPRQPGINHRGDTETGHDDTGPGQQDVIGLQAAVEETGGVRVRHCITIHGSP